MTPVDRITAVRGVRDAANVLLSHKDGATSYLTLTVRAPPGAEDTSITVWCPGGRYQRQLPTGGLRQAFRPAVEQLLDAVSTGRPLAHGARHGAAMVDILRTAETTIYTQIMPSTEPRPQGAAL